MRCGSIDQTGIADVVGVEVKVKVETVAGFEAEAEAETVAGAAAAVEPEDAAVEDSEFGAEAVGEGH